MTRIHDRLRHILETTPGLTQKGLAERMGLNPAAVNRMLYGRRNIMAEEIPVIEAYIGTALDISANDDGLKTEDDNRPMAMPSIPVYRYETGTRVLADWADRHPAQSGLRHAEAVYVSGREMEPRYFSGEIAYLHPSRPPQIGRDAFVELADGRMFLCRVAAMTDDELVAEFFNPISRRTFLRKNITAIYAVIARS